MLPEFGRAPLEPHSPAAKLSALVRTRWALAPRDRGQKPVSIAGRGTGAKPTRGRVGLLHLDELDLAPPVEPPGVTPGLAESRPLVDLDRPLVEGCDVEDHARKAEALPPEIDPREQELQTEPAAGQVGRRPRPTSSASPFCSK